MAYDDAIHNLAIPPEIVGRDVLQRQILQDVFESVNGPRIAVLAGPGGIGKSALAMVCGMELLERFSLVWLVRATNAQTAYADLLQLAERCGPSGTEQALDEEGLLQLLGTLLSKRSDLVLILDGAPDVDEALNYLGEDFAGRAIITTRSGAQPAGTIAYEVTPLSDTDSVAMLAGRLERAHDTANLRSVCEALGHFPLAIVHAAVFMRETGLSPQEYLREVERYWGETFARDPIGNSAVMQPLRLALELIFRRLAGADPVAGELLNIAAFFDPQGIDEDLLLAACTYGTGSRLRALAGKPAQVEWHVEHLVQYAILSRRERTLVASDLVMAAARDRLEPDEFAMFARIAISAIDRTFHVDIHKVESWPATLSRAAHARSAGEYAGGVKQLPRITAEVLNRAGEIIFRFGRYADAQAIFSKAKVAGELALAAENHPVYWTICNNLARAENQLRKGSVSIAQCRELVEKAEASVGADNPQLVDPLCTLGTAYTMNMKFPEAFEAFSRAYNLCMRDATNESRRGRVLNNLGHVKLLMGELDEAANLLNSAFAIMLHEVGDSHPDMACILLNLADLLRRRNNLTMARRQVERALRIDRTTFGPTHPDVARDLSYLAQIALQEGASAEAATHLAHAAAIDRRTLPQTHPRRAQRQADKKKVEAHAAARVFVVR